MPLEGSKRLPEAVFIEISGKAFSFLVETGKALVCINGGAAVAMLAFCGNYIGEINWLSVTAITCFAFGSLLAVGILFFSSLSLAHFSIQNVEKGNAYDKKVYRVLKISMALFLLGLILSTGAIYSLKYPKVKCQCARYGND